MSPVNCMVHNPNMLPVYTTNNPNMLLVNSMVINPSILHVNSMVNNPN